MRLFKVDPLQDDRWSTLVEKHRHASVFHTVAWLKALHHTYGYEPVVYTTSAPAEELSNALVFCDVRSFVTGRRLVSLPFSDHCAPLVQSGAEMELLLDGLQLELDRERWKYVEFRHSEAVGNGTNSDVMAYDSFAMHQIDLRPDADQLFRAMHKSSVRDRVRRAEREGVTCDHGRSEPLLRSFYHLLVMTRRRHGIPPQPYAWYRNLLELMGDDLNVSVASKDGLPIASIVTLAFNNTAVYKYGCSDSRFHNVGGMPLLLWTSIQDAKNKGMLNYDLGRSELSNTSLIEFKERLGAKATPLNYYRFPARAYKRGGGLAERTVRKLVSSSPDMFLKFLGELLYRHVG